MSKKLTTQPWDSAEFLDTPDAREEFMIAALETDDSDFIQKCVETVARAEHMFGSSRATPKNRSCPTDEIESGN